MISELDARSGSQDSELAGDIVLCSWARHFMGTGELMLGVILEWTSIQSRGE